MGAYVPWESGLYGVELIQYTSGATLSMPTNQPCSYFRQYAATNTYLWGMVETRETTVSGFNVAN